MNAIANLVSMIAWLVIVAICFRCRRSTDRKAQWAVGWIGGRAFLRADRDHVVLFFAISTALVLVLAFMARGTIGDWPRMFVAGALLAGTWSHLDRAVLDAKST